MCCLPNEENFKVGMGEACDADPRLEVLHDAHRGEGRKRRGVALDAGERKHQQRRAVQSERADAGAGAGSVQGRANHGPQGELQRAGGRNDLVLF